MRRTVIAAAWLVTAAVPLVAGALFLFGCCVLPFHGVLHHAMPLCHLASDMVGGEDGDHEHQHPISTPARERQPGPAKIFATETGPASATHAFAGIAEYRVAANDAIGYRSFITLGALRCDQDVGRHRVLNELFRI